MKGRPYDNRWATVVRTRTPTMVANPVQPGIMPRAIFLGFRCGETVMKMEQRLNRSLDACNTTLHRCGVRVGAIRAPCCGGASAR